MIPRGPLRAVHLISSAALGTFVYAPGDVTEGTIETLVTFVFFPLLAITGLLMWFGVRIARRRAASARR